MSSPAFRARGTRGTPAAVPKNARRAVRRGGRPSLIEAAELGTRILDVATELFLTNGYGATSIEAIARRAGISKRTLYHRYDDKAALFSAVVHRTIERMRPPADVPLVDGANAREMLERLAGLILHAALSPPALALHRLVVAESARFPKLAKVVVEQGGSQEAILLVAGILEHEVRAGRMTIDDRVFAAQQFLFMLVGSPQRRAMGLGTPLSPAEQDAWVRDTVNLFLNGCRAWVPATAGANAPVQSGARRAVSSPDSDSAAG